MKAGAILAAAILVLLCSLASGAWAIYDYRDHEESKRDFMRKGITQLSFRDGSGKTIYIDTQKMESYFERHDAKVAAVSVTYLIGSLVLFWLRTRVLKLANLN